MPSELKEVLIEDADGESFKNTGVLQMTPEMQKKMEELLVSADCGMFSSPDRWVGFRRGFKGAHNLMQEKVKVLVETFKNHLTSMEAINAQLGYQFTQPLMKAREALKGWE